MLNTDSETTNISQVQILRCYAKPAAYIPRNHHS